MSEAESPTSCQDRFWREQHHPPITFIPTSRSTSKTTEKTGLNNLRLIPTSIRSDTKACRPDPRSSQQAPLDPERASRKLRRETPASFWRPQCRPPEIRATCPCSDFR